ncbi:MAG TPA: hypothetical protein VHN98_02430 [Acidimicrobiales bacterium]|nr:hypothetical protein [Acidimicrobiales bacterium]
MSHLVTYSGPDGQRLHHQVEGLEDAVRHVEQLRNAGQGNDARIFRMVEVPIEVKTYYRVEIATPADDEKPAAKAAAPAEAAPSASPAPPASGAVAEPAAVAGPTPAPVAGVAPASSPVTPAPVKGEPVSANNGGRFGLFGKS